MATSCLSPTSRRKDSFKLSFSTFFERVWGISPVVWKSKWQGSDLKESSSFPFLGNNVVCAVKSFISNARFGCCIFAELLKSQNHFVSKSIRTVNYLWSLYKNFTLNAFQWLCGLLHWVTLLGPLVWSLACFPEEKNCVFWSQNSWDFKGPFGMILSSSFLKQAYLEQVFQNHDQLGFENGPVFKSCFCIIK